MQNLSILLRCIHKVRDLYPCQLLTLMSKLKEWFWCFFILEAYTFLLFQETALGADKKCCNKMVFAWVLSPRSGDWPGANVPRTILSSSPVDLFLTHAMSSSPSSLPSLHSDPSHQLSTILEGLPFPSLSQVTSRSPVLSFLCSTKWVRPLLGDSKMIRTGEGKQEPAVGLALTERTWPSVM